MGLSIADWFASTVDPPELSMPFHIHHTQKRQLLTPMPQCEWMCSLDTAPLCVGFRCS